jgi:hypothetical protein
VSKAAATACFNPAASPRAFALAPRSPNGQSLRSRFGARVSKRGNAAAAFTPAPIGSCAQPRFGRHAAILGGSAAANGTDTVRVFSSTLACSARTCASYSG